MKKIIIKSLVFIFIFTILNGLFVNLSYAEKNRVPSNTDVKDSPCFANNKNDVIAEITEFFNMPTDDDKHYKACVKKVSCVKVTDANKKEKTECTTTYQNAGHSDCDNSQGRYCQQVYILFGKTGTDVLKAYIRTIYIWGASLVGLVAVLTIIISGIQMSATGDNEAAKTRIMQCLAGLAVLFLSGLILYTINPTFFTLE